MKTDKIREAIADLQAERDLIDNAIQGLQAVLVRLNGHAQKEMPFTSDASGKGTQAPPRLEGSYLDMTIQLLKANGRPMRFKQILEQIRIIRDNPDIKRGSVESTLLRHIESKGRDARITKPRRGLYALA